MHTAYVEYALLLTAFYIIKDYTASVCAIVRVYCKNYCVHGFIYLYVISTTVKSFSEILDYIGLNVHMFLIYAWK